MAEKNGAARPKILIIEDEKDVSRILRYALEKEGYAVLAAHDGEAGLACFRRDKPDLVILDVMLPKMDGFEFCRIARLESDIPILMLTAKREEADRVLGLEMGADDYITKPFSLRELVARVKTALRRRSPRENSAPLVRVGDLQADWDRYEVSFRGKTIRLGPKEYECFKHLAQAQGKVLTRAALRERIWGEREARDIHSRTVDQHIARLRQKLGPAADRIVTVKNIGYRLRMD